MDALFQKIVQAKTGKAIKSPLQKATMLSERLGQPIYFKREDLQPTHAYKLRGAYNKARHLSAKNPRAVFCCASAGNHAQGVALAGLQLGHRVVIVVPTVASVIKLAAIKRLGATVVCKGESVDDSFDYAHQLARRKGYALIHPFDDDYVIAGQGTIALELYAQADCPIDEIFVPVGGGGLLCGVAVAARFCSPATNIISVEASDSAAFARSLQEQKRVRLTSVGQFADGTAVRKIGATPWKHTRSLVKTAYTVTTDEICYAIKLIYEDTRTIVEPSGALAVAGMLRHHRSGAKKRTGCQVAIISGANLNFHQLRYISERSQIGERSEVILGITIPEKQGAFLKLASLIGNREITECNYRYQQKEQASVFCGLAVDAGGSDMTALIARLAANKFTVRVLTDSDIAKTHVRYMIGGVSPIPERVFRFSFPERPGALLAFLKQINRGRWNISLFHYRNHGADYGRVLCGFQGVTNRAALEKSLGALGFEASDVTSDAGYALFLT